MKGAEGSGAEGPEGSEAAGGGAEDAVQQVLTCGEITIDEATRRVTVGGRASELSSAQFALLATFVRHPHQVLSRERLIRLAFGEDFDARCGAR